MSDLHLEAPLEKTTGAAVDQLQTERRYDKGERRFKHVGKGAEPVIEYDAGDPKKWVGKCPNNISDEIKSKLLNEAIAVSNGDRDLSVPKRLYAVHDGAIYEAQTSDSGTTYHAYPYRGKLSKGILTHLEKKAKDEGSLSKFGDWVKEHITKHGEKK